MLLILSSLFPLFFVCSDSLPCQLETLLARPVDTPSPPFFIFFSLHNSAPSPSLSSVTVLLNLFVFGVLNLHRYSLPSRQSSFLHQSSSNKLFLQSHSIPRYFSITLPFVKEISKAIEAPKQAVTSSVIQVTLMGFQEM